MTSSRGITEAFVRDATRSFPANHKAIRAAKRMVFNVIGTSVGAIASGRVDSLIALGTTCGGAPDVALPGDARSLDRYHAALVTGAAGHAEDFDDTHLLSIVHPAATAFGAAYAASDEGTSGLRFLQAVALSCEFQIRLALCLETEVRELHPASFTGLFGTMGAGLSAAHVAGAPPAIGARAVALALASSIGSRQSLGSFAKPLHTGRAAASGVLAARIAEAIGPTLDWEDAVEGERGVLNAHFDGRVTLEPIRVALSGNDHWEIVDVAFKPYPCGVLLHPLIDAALSARSRSGDSDAISRITVLCNPAVGKDTSIVDPKDSLQAKFSASHAVAVALVDGVLGMQQYEHGRVRDPAVSALRRRIAFEIRPDMPKDATTLRIDLDDGSSFEESVRHARGSKMRPMTDDDLVQKTELLFANALPGRARDVWAVVSDLDNRTVGDLRRVLGP